MTDTPAARPRRFGAAMAAAGMMYNQAVTVLSGVLIGRVVGAGDYGISNIAKNLFQVAVIVAPLGLDLALQRYLAGDNGNDPARRGVLARLRLLAIAVAIIPAIVLASGLAPWLAEHVYRYRDFAAVLLVTFAALPFAADAAVLGGAYRGVRDPGPTIIATQIVVPTARVLLTVVLFLFGYRLWAIIAATTAAQVAGWLFVSWRGRRDFGGSRGQGSWTGAREVLGFSWALGLALLITSLTKSVDVLVLGHFRPSVEVGRYVAVQLLVQMLTIFSAALGQTLGAQVAARYEAGDTAGIERLLIDNMRRIALAASPIYAIILFWGDRIDLVLGPSFVVDWHVVILLATNQYLFALFAYTGYGLSMTGRHRFEAGLLGCGLAATVVLCLLLVPRYGAPGAAVGTLAAVGGASVAQFFYTRRLLGLRLFRWSIFVPTLIAVVAAGLVRIAATPIDPRSFLSTALSVIVALGVYGAIAMAFLLQSDERQRVLRVLPFARFRG